MALISIQLLAQDRNTEVAFHYFFSLSVSAQSNSPPTIFSNISKKYLKYEHSIFTAITLVHATITSHLGFCNSLLMNLSVSIVAHSAGK